MKKIINIEQVRVLVRVIIRNSAAPSVKNAAKSNHRGQLGSAVVLTLFIMSWVSRERERERELDGLSKQEGGFFFLYCCGHKEYLSSFHPSPEWSSDRININNWNRVVRSVQSISRAQSETLSYWFTNLWGISSCTNRLWMTRGWTAVIGDSLPLQLSSSIFSRGIPNPSSPSPLQAKLKSSLSNCKLGIQRRFGVWANNLQFCYEKGQVKGRPPLFLEHNNPLINNCKYHE